MILFSLALASFSSCLSLPELLQLLLQLNPLAHVVGIYQELILNQRLPNPRQMILVTVFSIGFFVAGYSVFAHHRKNFADLV